MARNRPSIVCCRTGYDTMGGATTMTRRLLEGIDTERFDVTLVSQRNDALCERVRELDVAVTIVPYRGVLDTYDGKLFELPVHRKAAAGGRLLQYNLEFARRVDAPDILLCYDTRAAATLLPYLRLSSATTVWNVGLLDESTGPMRRVNGAVLRAADHVVVESGTQARRQLSRNQYERHAHKLSVLHKGIDTERFDPGRVDAVDDGVSRVGTAGLITPRKGLEQFVDAAALVADDRPDVTFTVAGETAREDDTQYRAALHERVADHGIADNVEFLGWVAEMPAYLASLDVFVLTSRNEGVPGVVREALAMEVPVVATDVGGTGDAVLDGETGFLVDVGDEEALADRISYLLAHPDERAALGERGREHVTSTFSMASYVRNYEAFFEEIL